MKSSIKYGLVLFSVLMSLSLGATFAEKQMASNETNKTVLKVKSSEAVSKNATNKTNITILGNKTNVTMPQQRNK